MKSNINFILLLSCFTSFVVEAQNIIINEYMTSNSSTAIPSYVGFEDWIELRNTSTTPYDLAGHYLTDDKTQTTKFQFTNTTGALVIPANGFLILICSGDISQGIKHTSFKISDGENIGLLLPNGTTFIDSLTIPQQRTDVSYGRNPSNSADWKYIQNPTPGSINNFSATYLGILSNPIFSQKTGFFTSSFNLSITHADPSAAIIYSMDASLPSVSNMSPRSFIFKNSYAQNPGMANGSLLSKSYASLTYGTPLLIQDKSSSPNQVSTFSSTWHQGAGYIPTSPVKKGTVIRAIASKTGYLPSDVVTNTYFFNTSGTKETTLPIISLSIQESHLFEYYAGIYTAGNAFDNWRAANPSTPADDYSNGNYYNKGDQWEFPAHFDLIENSTNSFQMNAGVRINGGTTRTYKMKSLRIYARGEYGDSKIDKKIFSSLPYTSYKSLLLHNGGQDFNYSLINDGTTHQAVAHMDLETQAFRPSIMYLNGEYWGIHNIRQRYDSDYFAQKFGVNPSNLDIITNVYPSPSNIDEGDLVHYTSMMDFITYNDLATQANYDFAKTLMDVKNLIDYQVSEIYFANLDWPSNNVGLWREKVPYSITAPKGKDGRWRWYLYDIDSGSGLNFVNNNSLDGATSATNNPDATFFMRNFLKNTSFKNDFINRFADMLNTAFLPTRLNTLFGTNKNLILSEIANHINRWQSPFSQTAWNNSINDMNSFAQLRPAIERQHIQSKFGISGTYNLSVNTDTTMGYVKVNTIVIKNTTPGINQLPYPWNGSYFNNIPIQLRVVPKAGFKLKHWLENSVIVSTDSVFTINTSTNKNYTAVFESYLYSSNLYPVAKILDNCGYKFSEWSALSAASTYPANMAFIYLNETEPSITAQYGGLITGIYNYTSKTRVNGLGVNGVAFINTGSSNTGHPSTKVGGAILAMNTLGHDDIYLSWTGGTVVPNSKEYAIRLQYRIGDLLDFEDVLDTNGNPIEYNRSSTAGTQVAFQNIKLPVAASNNQYIQLLWKYYYKGVQNNILDGSRDQLRIDDIVVSSKKIYTNGTQSNLSINAYSKIESAATINNPMVSYTASKSILLTPGFNAATGTVFLAQINVCPN